MLKTYQPPTLALILKEYLGCPVELVRDINTDRWTLYVDGPLTIGKLNFVQDFFARRNLAITIQSSIPSAPPVVNNA